MMYAENGDAIVQRSYLPGGALNTDSLFIRSYTGNDFTRHKYGLQYRYDAVGRTRALLHPSNLASTAQRDSFAYNAVTGTLDTVVSRLGQSFGFQYDVLGRMTGEAYPGGSRGYAYDADGRKTTHMPSTLTYDARGKILSATIPFSSVFYNAYSGLGMLVGTDWSNVNNSAVDVSDYVMDALGNTVWRRQASDINPRRPEHRYEYEPRTTRITLIANTLPTYLADQIFVDTMALPRDTTWRSYDDAGNVGMGQTSSWGGGSYGKTASQSYYSADERLRAIQTYDQTGVQQPMGPGTPESRGSFVEYRYDPLGRRVLVRTRRDGLCTTGQADVDCTGGIERFVWAGDNVLWELRGPGADSVPSPRLETAVGSGVEFGAVGYTHAGGVDRPLLAWKGTGATPALVVVPHMNWRGLFSGGTYLTGNATTHPIVWPGFTTTAWHQNQPGQQQTKVWTGSLLGGQGDASGQVYMRNRYFDPVTGQFTQTDPIGLAGGLNAYGFAAGDPVSYDDPFGLYVCLRVNYRQGRISREDQITIVKAALELATGAKITLDASNCISQVIGNPNNELYRRLRVLVAHPFRINIRFLSDPAARSGQHQAEWGPKYELNDADDEWGRVKLSTIPGDYAVTRWQCIFGGREAGSFAAVLVHELLGHIYGGLTNGDYSDREAIRVENIYHRQAGETRRLCHR